MRVLLAIDFSEQADIASALVRDMSLPPGSYVRLVTAIEPISAIWGFAPAELFTVTEEAEAVSRTQLAQVANPIRRAGVTVDAIVVAGRAADVVIEAAAAFAPDVIVVGSRGRGAVATSVLGSVSAEIVDRAPCAVLVARRSTLDSIVLADDGSASSGLGASLVRDLPPLRRAVVHVVSVVDVPFPAIPVDPSATAAAVEAYRMYERELPNYRAKSASIAEIRRRSLLSDGIAVTSEVREGDAVTELLSVARQRDADCIVVGSRGDTGLRRLFIGSVARGVLLGASCSVLIARLAKHVKIEPAPHADAVLAS